MGKYKVKVGIIGGTGLDDPANQILQSCSVVKCEDAKNEFGLPSSDLWHGKISDVEVVLLSRHKPSRKIMPSLVNYRANIEALRLAGCTHVLASTACGSLTEDICRGQLVIPDSYIDRTTHRNRTMYDWTSPHYSGTCHLPMEPAFDPKTSGVLELAAKELEIPVKKGATIVAIEGPRFSSIAESKMFQLWGAHLVNMTTCPEVSLAKEAGLLYASVAMSTDYDCWKKDETPVLPNEVVTLFKKNVSKVTSLLAKAVELIGNENWDDHIDQLKHTIEISTFSSSEKENNI